VHKKELHICGMRIYHSTRKNRRQFLALTTLKVNEFDELLPFFRDSASLVFETMNEFGQPRLRKFKFTSRMHFQSYEEMLFFALYYLKTNPFQEEAGAMFGMYQSQVSRWANRLEPILSQALALAGCLPTQDPQVLAELPGGPKLMDVTERPIDRPADGGRQKAYYSGKKKAFHKEHGDNQRESSNRVLGPHHGGQRA